MRRPGVPWVACVLAASFLARRADADTIAADKLPEPPVVDTGLAETAYLPPLHKHIHRSWADNFLRLVGEKLPVTDALNDPTKSADAELVIAADGQLTSVAIARSSGVKGFDDAVLEVLRDSAPFPAPPVGARSDDDRAHVRWTFARDHRRCSGIVVLRTYEPVEVMLPKLLRAGRRDEALRRLGMARGSGLPVDGPFALLANAWIKGALREPWVTVAMVRPLAARGDEDAIGWLKNAVRRPEVAAEAGAALVAAKAPLCPLLKGWFDTESWTDQKVATSALAMSSDPACAPGLTKVLMNGKAGLDARIAAAVALGAIDDAIAKQALADAAKHDNVKLRSAAMLAQIRPGAGRAKVIAMAAMLRDPVPEVRAAAAAGVVRAGGDSNLADLYVLFKDDDPRAALAALRELEQLKTEESTKLIARLARRPQPAVQKLAAQILVRRNARDQYPTLKPFLDSKTDAELRGLALVAADEPTMQAAVADAKLGIAVFRARLARGEKDQAVDWFLAHHLRLSPADQAAVMAEWLAAAPAAAPPAPPATTASVKPAASKPTASKSR
jgi:TonB family protein